MKRVLSQLFLRLVPKGLVYYGWNGNNDPLFLWSNLPACFTTLLVGVLSESPRWQYCLRPAIEELTLVNWVLEDPVDSGGSLDSCMAMTMLTRFHSADPDP